MLLNRPGDRLCDVIYYSLLCREIKAVIYFGIGIMEFSGVGKN